MDLTREHNGTALESPDGGRQEFAYDECSNLVRETSGVLRGQSKQILYEYDGLNRLVRIDYPDTGDTVYTYGGANDSNGAAGKILRVEDASGQVTSVTGSHWGHEFSYVTNILYDEYGQRTRIDYGNGTFTEYSYNPERRWLDSIRTQNKWGQSYQNISYSFDKAGNVLGYENDSLDAASGNYRTRQTYGYDSLYQLIRVDGATTYNPYRSAVPEFVSDYSQIFEFDSDGLGNMMSKVSTETISPQKSIGDNLNYSFDYVYDENYAHRLLRSGDRHYQYDANGNVTCEQDAPAPKAQSSITSSNANDGQSPAYGDFPHFRRAPCFFSRTVLS